MLRVLGCQERSAVERARGVHKRGEHITAAGHYKAHW